MKYYLVVQTITHPIDGYPAEVLCYGPDGMPLYQYETPARQRMSELQDRFPGYTYEVRSYENI